MLKRFKKFDKFKEYISFDFENRFAIIATAIMLILCAIVRFYSNYESYGNIINDLCIALIGAYIGSLALIFSGIVFLADLLTNRFEKMLIKYSEKEDAAERLYFSYLFLAFNLLCLIVGTVAILLFSNSNLAKPPIVAFELVFFVYLYFTFFVLAYFVALIRNTIDLILTARNIKNMKNIYERANEIRIDIILGHIYARCSAEETKASLKKCITDYVNALEDSDEVKKDLLSYFSKYYDFDETAKKSAE